MTAVPLCNLSDNQKSQSMLLSIRMSVTGHVVRRIIQLLNLFIRNADAIIFYTNDTIPMLAVNRYIDSAPFFSLWTMLF